MADPSPYASFSDLVQLHDGKRPALSSQVAATNLPSSTMVLLTKIKNTPCPLLYILVLYSY
jgi:hypothetical protein